MLRTILNVFYYPIILIGLALAIVEIIPIVTYTGTHIDRYLWMLYGVGGYVAVTLLPFVRKNLEWLQTFSHELTHTMIGLLFFRKIHSFHAERGTGMISYSGARVGDLLIGLSPYCLPIFTYVMLVFRMLGAHSMLHVFDVCVGVTVAFHISCFIKQTGLYQTDIQEQGYFRAFLFIIWGWVFNLSLVLWSIRFGVVDAMCRLWQAYWSRLVLWSECVWGWLQPLWEVVLGWF